MYLASFYIVCFFAYSNFIVKRFRLRIQMSCLATSSCSNFQKLISQFPRSPSHCQHATSLGCPIYFFFALNSDFWHFPPTSSSLQGPFPSCPFQSSAPWPVLRRSSLCRTSGRRRGGVGSWYLQCTSSVASLATWWTNFQTRPAGSVHNQLDTMSPC